MPSPFILEIAVQPGNWDDRATLEQALRRLLDGNASLAVSKDEGQTILRATDECCLNAAVGQLQHDLGHRLGLGFPQVAYRESFVRTVEVDYTHKKQSGSAGQFGRIRLTVEPGHPGQGIVFKDEVKGGNIPGIYVPSIERGIREAALTGPRIGFPIVDFTVTLKDGAFHDIDSSAFAFEITARGAMREAARKAGVRILEPIMKLVVLTPPCWGEAIVADLAGRRAMLETKAETEGSMRVIVALVPMARLFGYGDALASVSQGEARSAMLCDHYGEIPEGLLPPDDTVPAAAALRA
jgi:elongation factor G